MNNNENLPSNVISDYSIMASGTWDSRTEAEKQAEHKKARKAELAAARKIKKLKLPVLPEGEYSDIYSNPEKVGARIVDAIDDSASYEWSVFIVFEDIQSGRLFYYYGSGCSCNSPCDGIRSLAELDQIEEKTYKKFEKVLDDWYGGDAVSKTEMKSRVVRLLKRPKQQVVNRLKKVETLLDNIQDLSESEMKVLAERLKQENILK